jgi:hypothetical protein
VYSVYFRAQVVSSAIWLITGCLRSAEGYVLERTLDGSGDIIEFFVSSDCVDEFTSFMELFRRKSMIVWFKQMPNRVEYEKSLGIEDLF